MKAIFIDTETGGLIPGEHALLEIAALFCVIDGASIKEYKAFNSSVKGVGEVTDGAISVNHLTREQIETYPAQEPVMDVFTKLLQYETMNERIFVFGYRVEFDMAFIDAAMTEGQRSHFHRMIYRPAIDVMSLAGVKMMRVRHKMPNFKLTTVAKQRGITVDDEQAHGALYDARLTLAVYNSLVGVSV